MMYCVRLFLSQLFFYLTAATDPHHPDHPFIEPRIYGGHNVTISEAPYQVALLYLGGHRCGGTLITSQHVITAAHCTYDQKTQTYRYASDYLIRAGSMYHNRGGETVKVLSYRSHPDFNPTIFDNDIAVFKLVQSLQVDDYIKPIPLADGYLLGSGTRLFVTGWGALENGQKPQGLQGVYLSVVSTIYCKAKWGADRVTSGMFCAGGGKESTCSADSGGPAVVDGVVVGLVSWGTFPCGRRGYPEVYTKIAVFREFIEGVIGAL